jgi:type IV pilus assembly protein PilM
MSASKTILGIDLRVAAVKVAEVEGGVLKNFGMSEVPYELLDQHPQLEDAKVAALQKLLQENKIKTREAIVVLGGEESLLKIFSIPELVPAEAREAIKWKLTEELPYPIEEAIFDVCLMSKGGGLSEKVEYFTACMTNKLYREISYILSRAGLKLVGITVVPEALQELYRSELSREPKAITSIIYMGKRTTNISLFRGEIFEFNRELSIGGENLTRALAGLFVSPQGQKEISLEEAEKIKLKYGLPVDLETFPKLEGVPLNQLQANVRPTLEKIQSEIARTFEYYKGQTGERSIHKIILTGGASSTPHLKEFLSAGLGIPVTSPEPLPGLNPQISVSLGAALTGTRRINLLPEEIRFRRKILLQKFLRPPVLLSLFTGLLVLIYSFFYFQAFSLKGELNQINKKLTEFKPRLASLEAIEKTAREEEKRKQALKSYEQKGGRIPVILEEISRVIPESVTLNTLHLSGNNLRLAGLVFKKDESAEAILSRFVLGLSLAKSLEEVRLISAAKNNTYTTETFNFEITARVKD